MKDNFLLKKSRLKIFEALTDEEAGKLIKGIFNYVITGDSGLEGMMKAIFIPIKDDIDKNEEKYKKICERNKENGKNGGRPKNDIEEEPKETEKKPVGCFGENTHISYITNHNIINHNSNNQLSNNNLNIIKQVIDYLNNKINSNYKYNTKATQQKINARLNEGYNLNDFIVVIDKKTKEWKSTEFEKYLCPDTLFGTKFEKYLNQKEIQKQKTNSEKQWEVLKGVYDGTIKIN